MDIIHGQPGHSNVYGRSIMQRHGYNNWGQNVLPIHNLFPAVSTKYYSTPNPSGGFMIPINHDMNSLRGSPYQYSHSTGQQYVPGTGGTVSNAILGSSRKDWLDHTTKAYYNGYKPYAPPSETVQLLYPPGTKVVSPQATETTEKDETKDESVIKDEVRDKKSTKRHENVREKYDDGVNEDRKRNMSDDDDEEYEEDEEEEEEGGDDEEDTEHDGDRSNDEDDEDEEYEEENDASENDREEDGTSKIKVKDSLSSTPFYTDKHSLSKIKIPDPDNISESPFFPRQHSGRTGKTFNFGEPYRGSGDSDFITTEKSLSYENAPNKLTTKITPLTFTKKYQPANFSFGVNYKPKQRYKSTYVPSSPNKNHYNMGLTEDNKSEYDGSPENTSPNHSGYSDYSYKIPQHTTDTTYAKYRDHSHYSDERDYTSRKPSYPSHQEADYIPLKNFSREHVYDPVITTSKYYLKTDKSHETGPQNERPSNHKYYDSYEETTPYYNTDVTTTSSEAGEYITIPNSMKIPHANELTTTEKPLAIKIHYHHHDEKVYEDDNNPSSTPQTFYHDYANDYDNYTEYADYTDYTGQPAADYDNITQTLVSSTEDKIPKTPKKYQSYLGSEQTKEESGENNFKGQDFYNDYYETVPSTTTKRHMYDSKTSTTNKERQYTSLPTTANPIQLDSYQNVILNLKNSKPPRDDSIYFNTTSYVYNFNKYDTTATPLQKHKKRIIGRLKKITKPTTPTTPKIKIYPKIKESNEIDYDTYPTSSSKQKMTYTDAQQDNSLISNKLRKKQEVVRLSKPRIKLRSKPPTSPRVHIYPPLTKTKTSTDRDLSESKLHHSAVTVDKLSLISQ